jgi:hypothetical protein
VQHRFAQAVCRAHKDGLWAKAKLDLLDRIVPPVETILREYDFTKITGTERPDLLKLLQVSPASSFVRMKPSTLRRRFLQRDSRSRAPQRGCLHWAG